MQRVDDPQDDITKALADAMSYEDYTGMAQAVQAWEEIATSSLEEIPPLPPAFPVTPNVAPSLQVCTSVTPAPALSSPFYFSPVSRAPSLGSLPPPSAAASSQPEESMILSDADAAVTVISGEDNQPSLQDEGATDEDDEDEKIPLDDGVPPEPRVPRCDRCIKLNLQCEVTASKLPRTRGRPATSCIPCRKVRNKCLPSKSHNNLWAAGVNL
jgi:hypothetical protein